MISIVNKVGVDINKAMRNSYYAHLLSYVCGLGPRKADLVIKKVNSHFVSRRENDEDASDKLIMMRVRCRAARCQVVSL